MLLVLSSISTYILIPYVNSLLKKANVLRRNYNNQLIPVGLGITLIPVLIINCGILLAYREISQKNILIFMTGNLTMAFIGIIDDLIGNRDTLGFKGHIGALLKGQLTTGGLKAVMGGLMAAFISIAISKTIGQLFYNTIIIALTTNLINLLDLRPGRGVKAFFLISLLFLMLGLSNESKLFLYIVLGYTLVYFPMDLKGKSMMGDVGSNTLGISLGIIAALSFSDTIKLIIILILIIIHLIAEKYSLTRIIKRVKIFNYFDELGR
ncbi:glycosyltransferase [Alkaliphilus pronyensis]|uniref:Glycosyltransferase n=1 Tax=Alkaliphilus pronyensis TaxID=1482732 RepID=A0A6I0FDX5_9FIRM|nr:glycosyltransferase [Alkaliphilus pronyensis]KAB3537417.1 glycosyltransferase [Alkaliphilus pronyensis]